MLGTKDAASNDALGNTCVSALQDDRVLVSDHARSRGASKETFISNASLLTLVKIFGIIKYFVMVPGYVQRQHHVQHR